MTIFIVLTYKVSFSNQIIDYFKSLNPINHFHFNFFGVGLDQSKEEHIIKSIVDRIDRNQKVENVVIFSDVGNPTKVAKRLKFKNKDITVLRSNGSIIENGFLTYMMLNTKTPIESVRTILDKKIEK